MDFPHATHAFLIERYTTHHSGRKRSTRAALGPPAATPTPPTSEATSAATGIENKLHRVRDVTDNEVQSRARTGTAPRVMASLRTLATSAHRQAGHTTIAPALHHTARNATRALTLLGIPA
jgi:hypothetical protein